MIFCEITSKEASEFLLPRHYSGRTPQISRAFGWYNDVDGELQAVCTFGKPVSNPLCIGVCGKEYASQVYELNRLCRVDSLKAPLSQFVSLCLKALKKENWIIISYSDTAMNHHGYIYQACNFLYTGCTKPRTDIYSGDSKHSRHYTEEDKNNSCRKVRSAKHRYIYFCSNYKRQIKEWKEHLNYPIMPYPKGDNNENYVLGTYLQDRVIEKKCEQ